MAGATGLAAFVLGPGELARLFAPEIQFPNQTYQLPLPTDTHLRSVENRWGVDSESLELMNGDPRELSGNLNTRVLWLPNDTPELGATNSNIGPEAERLIKGKLLITRAMIERDETTDSGWPAEETTIIQGLLHKATNRVVEFAGPYPLLTTGFVRVFRPSAAEREKLISGRTDNPIGLFGHLNSGESVVICQETVQHGGVEGVGGAGGVLMKECSNENSLVYSIAILASLGDSYYQNRVAQDGYDKTFHSYTDALGILTAHELAHAYLGDIQLGSKLSNHGIVYVAGVSMSLAPLIGKGPDELAKLAYYYDYDRVEVLPWKLIKKLTGGEFYAKLIKELLVKYGSDNLKFTDEQVIPMADKILRSAGSSFNFETLISAFSYEPEPKDFSSYQLTSQYTYPKWFADRISNDTSNPDGIVSWWLPVNWPAPVDITKAKRAWAVPPNQPFPNKDGYYTNFVFLINGAFKNGPPDGNRLAIPVWAPGGGRTSPDSSFWFNIIDPSPDKVQVIVEKVN